MTFKDITKIQINKDTKHVHFGIKVSETFVHNLVFELSTFILLMQKDVKWSGKIHNNDWVVEKLPSKTKIYSKNYEYHYRLTNTDWEIVRKQFASALRKSNLA